MSKNTYFTGQPVYGQGINLLDRADNHQKKRIRLQMDGVFTKKNANVINKIDIIIKIGNCPLYLLPIET